MAAESGVSAGSAVEVIREVPVATKATGDPQVLGWLVFVAGGAALGLQLTGFVPQAVLGAPLAIILGAAAVGILITTVWAAYLGQTYVAGAFGTFAGFWVSYTVLVLGALHNWFAIPPANLLKVVDAFLIAWAITMFLLMVSTIRLPLAYTVVLALVDVALIILAITYNSSTPSEGMIKLAGAVVFAFTAIGAYIWLSCADQSLGGTGYPLGKPLRS